MVKFYPSSLYYVTYSLTVVFTFAQCGHLTYLPLPYLSFISVIMGMNITNRFPSSNISTLVNSASWLFRSLFFSWVFVFNILFLVFMFCFNFHYQSLLVRYDFFRQIWFSVSCFVATFFVLTLNTALSRLCREFLGVWTLLNGENVDIILTTNQKNLLPYYVAISLLSLAKFLSLFWSLLY